MAEETVVKETLTEEMIAAGAELTKALNRAHWPVVAALWLFEAENNQWRLVLASPSVDAEGPRRAYEQVNNALRAVHPPLPLESVRVAASDDPIVRVLRSADRTGQGIERRRIFRSAINGHFVDDAYVYMVAPVAPAA